MSEQKPCDLAGPAVACGVAKPPTSDVAPKGWGSFHSEREEERVEVLIRKADADYTPPKMLVDVDWIKAYPICGIEALPATATTPAVVPFGAETKKALFYLEESCTFLNHGAFGAALRPVVEVARRWQERMESQPLRFIDRELLPLLVYVTRETARFFNAPARDVVMLANATTGLNTVLRSLGLREGERIVSLDLGYGATDKMLKHVCTEAGAHHDRLTIPLPVPSAAMIVGALKRYFRKHAPAAADGVSASAADGGAESGSAVPEASKAATRGSARAGGVRLVVLDWVNSNSGVRLPVAELVAACRAEGVEVLVDGAHCWGSLSVDLAELRPTYFVANAHKWLCAAKGCAMLYVDPAAQESIVPLNISHGHGGGFTSSFVWTGLQDYGPWLSLLTAFDFWRRVGADVIRARIHGTVREGAALLCSRWNTELIAPESLMLPMVTVRLPGPRVPQHSSEHTELQDALHFKYNIEVPVRMLKNRLYVRLSAHVYTDPVEFEKLADALLELRPALWGDEDSADALAAESAAEVKPESAC